jgi:hypothetical protein
MSEATVDMIKCQAFPRRVYYPIKIKPKKGGRRGHLNVPYDGTTGVLPAADLSMGEETSSMIPFR